mmetsp:Transcript_1480/g.2722  ORF Transcript_1480/g.2722 Transcript_1480/m.2722 type:complete len:120 (-) Transcript_1480:44-403(-)
MAPGGGVGITSLCRETSLPEICNEMRKQRLEGLPNLGKASSNSIELTKARDIAMRKAHPELFFDSHRHTQRVRELRQTDPTFNPKLKPSVSCPSISLTARASAGTSTYIDLLKRQWGMI